MQQLAANYSDPVDDDTDDNICGGHGRRRRLRRHNMMGELDRCAGHGAFTCTAQKFAQKYDKKQSIKSHHIIISIHQNHHIRLRDVDDQSDKRPLLNIYNQSQCTNNHYHRGRHHQTQLTLSSWYILYISTISLVLLLASTPPSASLQTQTNSGTTHRFSHDVHPADQYASDRESNTNSNVPTEANQHHQVQYRQSPDVSRNGGSDRVAPPLCNDCLAIPLIAIMDNGKQVNGFIIQSSNQKQQQLQQQQNNQEANRHHINTQRSPSLAMRHEAAYERPNSHNQAPAIKHAPPKLEPKSDDKCPMEGAMTVCDQIDSYPAEMILHKLEVAKKRLGQSCFNIDSLFSDERDHSSEPFDEPRPTIKMHNNIQQQHPPPPPKISPSKSAHNIDAPHQNGHHHHQNHRTRPDSSTFNHLGHAYNGNTNSTQRPRYSSGYLASADRETVSSPQSRSGPAAGADVHIVRQDPRGRHAHHRRHHAISVRTIAGQDNEQRQERDAQLRQPKQLSARQRSHPIKQSNGELSAHHNSGQDDGSSPEGDGQATEFLRIVEGQGVSISGTGGKQTTRRRHPSNGEKGRWEGDEDRLASVGGEDVDKRHAVKRSRSSNHLALPQVDQNPAELASTASEIEQSRWSSMPTDGAGPASETRQTGANEDEQSKLGVGGRRSGWRSSEVECNTKADRDKVVSVLEGPNDRISSRVEPVSSSSSSTSMSSSSTRSAEPTANYAHNINCKVTSEAIAGSTSNLSAGDKRNSQKSSRLAGDHQPQLRVPKWSVNIETGPQRAATAKTTTTIQEASRNEGPPAMTKPQNTTTGVRGRRRQLSRRQVANVRVVSSGGGGVNSGAEESNSDRNRGGGGVDGDDAQPSRPAPTEPSDSPVQPEPVCRARSTYISPKAALNDKKQWKYVVNAREQDPRIRQIIRVDICENPFGPCSDQVSLPFGFTSQCKQKYAKKKLLALDAQSGLLEVDTFFIPSCCVCQLVPDTGGPPMSLSTLDGSVPSPPITTTMSSAQPDTGTSTGALTEDDPGPEVNGPDETAAGGEREKSQDSSV